MKEILDRILFLPKAQKTGILIGLIVLLIGVDWSFDYSPRSQRIFALQQEITGVQDDLDRKRKLTEDLPKLKKQLQGLDSMLNKAVTQLPGRKEIPELLSNISAKAREAGLEVLIFRPQGENPRDFYAEIPVDIVVRGGFHNVVTFFDEVGRLNRLVNVRNIEMRNPKINGAKLSVQTSTQAVTFRFLDEAERAKIAAQRAAKKKK
ncbi:MAG: type 4a pilus biogenesis protein PilO [Candidatus Binatia bacterium]